MSDFIEDGFAHDGGDDFQEEGFQTEEKPTLERKKINKSDSAQAGFLSGSLSGFSDDLIGGIKAGKDVAGDNFTLSDLPARFHQRRKEQREYEKMARGDNPVSYGAAEVGGGLTTALLPGANTVKGAAVLGAVRGAGNSEADNVVDLAKDTTFGAGTGAVTQGAMNKIVSPAASYLSEKIPTLAADGISAAKEVAGKVGDKLGKYSDLIDLGAGAAGWMASKDPAMAALTGTASRFLKKGGSQAISLIADGVESLLRKAPDAFSRWGGLLNQAASSGAGTLAVTHQALMRKDPEYRKTVEQQSMGK